MLGFLNVYPAVRDNQFLAVPSTAGPSDLPAIILAFAISRVVLTSWATYFSTVSYSPRAIKLGPFHPSPLLTSGEPNPPCNGVYLTGYPFIKTGETLVHMAQRIFALHQQPLLRPARQNQTPIHPGNNLPSRLHWILKIRDQLGRIFPAHPGHNLPVRRRLYQSLGGSIVKDTAQEIPSGRWFLHWLKSLLWTLLFPGQMPGILFSFFRKERDPLLADGAFAL